MASRTTPTPHPSTAGILGGRALQAAIFLGVIVPVLQHIAWVILVDVPSTSEVLSQPPYAWLYIGVLGIIPPLMVILGITQAATEAGAVGGVTYFLMALAGQSLLGQPLLAILTILGLTLGLFVFLAVKVAKNSRNRSRSRRGGYR